MHTWTDKLHPLVFKATTYNIRDQLRLLFMSAVRGVYYADPSIA